jgi:hypothetical protein
MLRLDASMRGGVFTRRPEASPTYRHFILPKGRGADAENPTVFPLKRTKP